MVHAILIMEDKGLSLVFVYNADSGLLNALNDGILKILSPDSYDCRLCGLTFGVMSMKSPWRTFISGLGVPVEFLHRDEFQERYVLKDAEFPSAYIIEGEELKTFISMEEMNGLGSLEELMDFVKVRLTKTMSD
jgi:hypothetical protein